MMKRLKVAIFHHNLSVGGGSEGCAAWIAEALKDDYAVSIITSDCADFDSLNNAYFTDLKINEINLIKVPIPNWAKKRFNALRWALLANFCRKKASGFDLMISAYNVMDFGVKGIQRIADFSFDDKLRRSLSYGPKGISRIFYMDSPFRLVYLKICASIAQAAKVNWKRNITIANSFWAASVMEKNFGIRSEIIYPPVAGEFPQVSWDRKENGFICMGRLVPGKEIEKVIMIISKLRQKGHNLHLHILGKDVDKGYVKYLKQNYQGDSNWFFTEGLVLGKEKLRFLAEHKFGISGQQNEAFGIAVAEMVKSGAIVWVPNSGGQVEVVNHPGLVYDNLDDAVIKIEKVLNDQNSQLDLINYFVKENERFSSREFKDRIKRVVRDFFAGKPA